MMSRSSYAENYSSMAILLNFLGPYPGQNIQWNKYIFIS